MKYDQIPDPRDFDSKLLGALSVTLPKAITCSGMYISTRKNLELKQKK